MMEVAQVYLGNLNDDADWLESIAIESCLELQLNSEDRYKGRIHSHTKDGIEVGIIKNRDRPLRSGDLFRTDSHKIIKVKLKEQELLVLDLSQLATNTPQAKLVQLGHVLGNNHYPVEVRDCQILVKLITDKLTVEKLINDLQIDGLRFGYKHMSEHDAIAWTEHSH